MKRGARVGLWFSASAALLLVASVGAATYFLDGLCENEILAETSSPDASLKLVVFGRDCGATTGFTTQATLLAGDATLPNSSGNVFVADGNGGAPAGLGGGPELRAHWEGRTSLVLEHHAAARVFKKEQSVNGVEIRYQTFQ